MKKSFWENFAFIYDIAMKRAEKSDTAAAEYIADFLNKDFCMLEAACGTGRFSCVIAKYVKELISCDYADNMVKETRKKAERRGIHNIKCSVQDITRLEFEDNTFDAVMAANVLHLLPEPERAIKELKRVLKPGGLVIIPNYINAERKSKVFLRFIGLLGFKPKSEWNKNEFLNFLRENNLEVLDYKVFEYDSPLCVAVMK